jgi:hypothetical protein
MEENQFNRFSPKKKWKEYLIDFMMLFVAVTLGFYAENLRDQHNEKNREISYLKNVHEDLIVDLTQLEFVTLVNQNRLLLLDSLILEINKADPDLPSLYYFIRNLVLRTTFESSHMGLDQIKTAGGLRLIQNNNIISGIQQYERLLNSANKLEELRERMLEQARLKTSEVFDASTIYQMVKNQNSINILSSVTLFNRPEHAAPFVVRDRKNFNELIGLIITGVNSNIYLNAHYANLKSIAKELDAAIMAEYGNQFVDK